MKSLKEIVVDEYGTDVVSPKQLKQMVERWENAEGKTFPYNIRPVWTNQSNKVGPSKYKIPDETSKGKTPKVSTKAKKVEHFVPEVQEDTPVIAPSVTAIQHRINFIPASDSYYVPWGNHVKINKIIKSRLFFPTFITGQSGNGKTTMVEQVCAKLKREFIRVNITVETDEDDLLGGFRLEKGETVWKDGPVVEAMKRGAVLLLDEVDLASTKIMCLQPVLEGKAIYLKKINVLVKPTEGFTVVATANTKGRGSEDGRFMGTGILNEAFLDRFSTTFFQEYAKKDTEVKILVATCTRVGIKPEIEFINLLTDWAETIREAQSNGSIEDTISTRRLVNIIEAYSIFGNQGEAVKLSVERFEDETKESFLDFYKKLLPNEEMVNDFGKNEV